MGKKESAMVEEPQNGLEKSTKGRRRGHGKEKVDPVGTLLKREPQDSKDCHRGRLDGGVLMLLTKIRRGSYRKNPTTARRPPGRRVESLLGIETKSWGPAKGRS